MLEKIMPLIVLANHEICLDDPETANWVSNEYFKNN